jgi:multiple sugar transport system ATP-binding protein
MAEVAADAVVKQFPDGTVAVDEVSIEIADGEFFVLVGPSGCGKSTLLRMIAGLEEITSGEIRIGGRVVNDLEPRERDIAMVFQDYALYPHLNVYDNLAFGLRRRRTPRGEIDGRVRQVAQLLGIDPLLHRRPGQLSGGQRQRVAMGRAIVREPRAFLMDEPLSNLDAKFRVQMRAELLKLHQRITTTTIYVTHDQVEAMTMGDRVAVLRDGKLQQIGTPQELYKAPANLFVAGFIGSPAMNFAEARVEDGKVRFGRFALPLDRTPLDGDAGRRIALGVRPEAFEDAALVRDTTRPRIAVTVDLVEHMGAETLVTFDVGAAPVHSEDMLALVADLDEGEEESAPPETAVFTARLDPKTDAASGEPQELAVDVEQLYFFDLVTGTAIGTGAAIADGTRTGSARTS